MDVVGHAPDLKGFELVLPGNSSQIGPDPFLSCGVNPRLPVFGAENDVVDEASKGVGHRQSAMV
jgi:hypothetical protein